MVELKTNNNPADDALEREITRLQQMITSPQMRKMRARATRAGQPYIRPRNAATIILVDGEPGNHRILMGQRNKNMKFMPGALVFPGGAVDRGDGGIPTVDELDDTTSRRIHNNLRGRPPKRATRALALAAVRELAEETGLLLGEAAQKPPTHKDWQFFKTRHLAPTISPLRLLARAITPPGPPRRFDTWFFVAPASAIGFTPAGGFAPSGELENLHWLTPEEAIAKNTQEITRVMLVELMNKLQNSPQLDTNSPAPNYFFSNGRFQRKLMP